MPRTRRSKYFWPASAITPEDMALLHAARAEKHIPISRLIAQAVRNQYGQVTQTTQTEPRPERKAA